MSQGPTRRRRRWRWRRRRRRRRYGGGHWGRTCRPFCHCDITHPSQFEPSPRVLHRYSARVRDQHSMPSTPRPTTGRSNMATAPAWFSRFATIGACRSMREERRRWVTVLLLFRKCVYIYIVYIYIYMYIYIYIIP